MVIFNVLTISYFVADLKSMLPRLARRINQKQDPNSPPVSARGTPRLGSEERIISVFNPAQRSPSGSLKDNMSPNLFNGTEEYAEPRPARRRHTRKSQTGSICYAAADLPPEIKSLRNQDIYNEPDSAADRALHAVSQMINNNNNSSNNDTSYYDNNVDFQQPASPSMSQQLMQRVEGRIVQQDHAQYALTYGMMLGIRVTVRKIPVIAKILLLFFVFLFFTNKLFIFMIQTGRRELPGAQRSSSLSSAPN